MSLSNIAAKPPKKNHSGSARVFITGVTGFIAPAVAEHLVAAGYAVSGLVRKSFRPTPSLDRLKGKIEIYEGDLTDYYGLRNILETARPDYILHFGAISPVAYSFDHPQEVTKVNYLGTINLAEAARQVLPNLKAFIFSSTMEVPGHQPHKPFTEDLVPHPACPYAVAKLACEKYLEYMHATYNFPTISIRQTNCYGRKDNDYFVVEAFITQMLKNKVVNFGRKEPVRNFIHIDDLCSLYQAMLGKIGSGSADKAFGEMFFIGPPNGLTIGDLQTKIAKIMKWSGQVNWNTREIRAGEVFYLNSKNDKIRKAFGWSPEITLDEGLKRTVKFWGEKLLNEK